MGAGFFHRNQTDIFKSPETIIIMDAANPILGNPLLLMAILLFLAILPRALRQKEKTALDRMVERFEEEELKTTTEEEPEENDSEQEQTAHPKDPSLAYLMEDIPTSPEMQEDRSIPPFPVREKEPEEKDELVKIVKEGIPISHNEETDFSLAPKKKVKLIKQESPIPLGESKESQTKASTESLKSKSPAQGQKSKQAGSPVSEPEDEESDNNWVEAEIPGLIMNPPPEAERSESIPTFKASPKAKHHLEAEKPQKSPPKEKQGLKTKNLVSIPRGIKDPEPKIQVPIKTDSPTKVKYQASKSEEIKDPKPKKQAPIKTKAPELKIEISEPKPKTVEIKASMASHKNITQKAAGQEKAKAPSAKAGKNQKAVPAKVAKVPPQREDIKTSPEKAKPKPFLLDLKYLEQEELETGDPIVDEHLSADMMDVVIARLNALQNDLENQLVSIPGELTASENLINGNMRKDRVQDSLSVSEETVNEPSNKKEVSLEELDSFLFTRTQRKNRE